MRTPEDLASEIQLGINDGSSLVQEHRFLVGMVEQIQADAMEDWRLQVDCLRGEIALHLKHIDEIHKAVEYAKTMATPF